jgi:hypothetical protein
MYKISKTVIHPTDNAPKKQQEKCGLTINELHLSSVFDLTFW